MDEKLGVRKVRNSEAGIHDDVIDEQCQVAIRGA